MTLPPLTIGVEEEYQIIEPKSRELTSFVQEFLELGRLVLDDQIKPEFMQSQVEVGSRICHNIRQVRQEIVRLRRTVCELAEAHSLTVAAASTHPFSAWTRQKITAGERYTKLETDLGEVGRRLLIFGMHVHIGIDDRELMIDVMNQARYFMPHVLALSTSSPFWQGRETGLKSYRSIIFEDLPRTGLPPLLNSWSDYENIIDVLLKTNCIDHPSKIWWDIRPHSQYPTLEYRITDMCTKVDEAVCIVALYLAITAKLIRLRQNNQSWRSYRHHLITENKWRAVRYGIDGNLIDFGKVEEVPMPLLAVELLAFVDDVVDELGIRKEVDYIHTILSNGTSADRQLNTFHRTGDLKAVVDQLVKETREGWS